MFKYLRMEQEIRTNEETENEIDIVNKKNENEKC